MVFLKIPPGEIAEMLQAPGEAVGLPGRFAVGAAGCRAGPGCWGGGGGVGTCRTRRGKCRTGRAAHIGWRGPGHIHDGDGDPRASPSCWTLEGFAEG